MKIPNKKIDDPGQKNSKSQNIKAGNVAMLTHEYIQSFHMLEKFY